MQNHNASTKKHKPTALAYVGGSGDIHKQWQLFGISCLLKSSLNWRGFDIEISDLLCGVMDGPDFRAVD